MLARAEQAPSAAAAQEGGQLKSDEQREQRLDAERHRLALTQQAQRNDAQRPKTLCEY